MKAYEIPVSRPAFKMLKRDCGYTHFLRVDKLVMSKKSTRRRTEHYEKYLNEAGENQVMITLVCPYASHGNLYTIARMIEHTFNQKFLLFVEAAVAHELDASEAIRKFMDKYDLAIEEFEWETAWKKWQRYRKREKELDLIPLW
ncbi:hypothetical protein [Cyclobacterium jeungdonense]|uniref:Uncharacterized protein n=1 Tax=Cyclobacterium jeungdonense TaxID=708087 RepID=A0ABT8C7A6_9BACT|nr:hypothetical protein [Cyclobacterium jeungdonense]MDN3688673.1 hypothetical protein [Cyclobacterium jeungdonense]